MSGLLRKLAIFLCAPIYKLIPQIYNIFYVLSSHRFFEEDTIKSISSNIYVLISVVMLFAFSANILAAIANPDLLTDKKKGVGSMFKRAIIGLALIVLIPFAFDKAYEIQDSVISNNLIEKIVVGVNFTDNNGGNGGQVIAGTLISSVLKPDGDDVTVNEDVSDEYYEMVVNDIKRIDDMKYDINVTKDGTTNEKMFTKKENYAFLFDGLIAIIAGIMCCYLLIIFSMDVAVRIFKLAFLELTTPIIVVSYMSVGDSIIKKWGQELGKTFVDVFVRIACLAFFIFLVANLDGFLDRVFDDTKGIDNFGFIDKGFLAVLLIIGMLIFIKQIPDFVNKVFGTNLQSKGGIEGRLGEMAVAGKYAQQAWKGIRNAGLIGMGAAGLAVPAALGAAVGLGANRLTGGKVASGLRTAGRAVSTAGKTAGSVLKGFSEGNPITAIPKAVKSYKDSDYGKAMQQVISANKKNKKRERAGLNESGALNDNTLESAIGGFKNLVDDIENMNISKKDKDILKKRASADLVKAIMSKAKDANDNINNEFDTMIANAQGNEALQKRLMELKTGYKSGNMSLDDIVSKLNEMADHGEIGGFSASKIASNASKLYSINETASGISEFKNFIDQQAGGMNFMTTDADGKAKLNVTNLGIVAGKSEKYADNVKAEYDAQISKIASQSAKSKEEADVINATFDELNSEYSRKIQETSKDHYKYTAQTSNTNGSQDGQNTSGSQGGQNTNGSQDGQNTSGSQGGQNTNGSQGGQNTNDSQTNSNNTGSNAQQNVNVDMSNMSQYFDEISKTIQDTNKETNKILNDQLKAQQNILSENQTQNKNLRNINSGINNINDSMDKVNSNIKRMNEDLNKNNGQDDNE